MGAAHTPGPWFIAGDDALNGHGYIVAANGVFVAKPLIVDREANARLLAAAPELLAKLENIANFLEASPVKKLTAHALARDARALITKATGA